MPKPRDLDFAERFKRLRVAAGFTTQRALAKAIDRDPQTVHLWENGRVPARLEDLQALAHVFGKTVPELLEDGGESPHVHPELEKFFRSPEGAKLSGIQRAGLQMVLQGVENVDESRVKSAVFLLGLGERKPGQ